MKNSAANWIVERRKCRLDTAFGSIRDFVQCYVDAGNDMLSDEESQHPFSLKGELSPRPKFVVSGVPFGASADVEMVSVHFVLNTNDITISYPQAGPNRDLPELVITQKWDPRKEACVLFLNGKKWTNQQVSQMAVEPLFFA